MWHLENLEIFLFNFIYDGISILLDETDFINELRQNVKIIRRENYIASNSVR